MNDRKNHIKADIEVAMMILWIPWSLAVFYIWPNLPDWFLHYLHSHGQGSELVGMAVFLGLIFGPLYGLYKLLLWRLS